MEEWQPPSRSSSLVRNTHTHSLRSGSSRSKARHNELQLHHRYESRVCIITHSKRWSSLSALLRLLDVCAQCRPTSKETFPRYTLFNLQVGITIERGRCVGGIPRRLRRYIIIRQSKIPSLLCIESAALSLLTLSLSLERILQQVE